MKLTIGIDEVGRGCWAGPLVAGAAIILPNIEIHHLLRDSKKLSARQRQQVAKWIEEHVMYGLGWVSAYEVDTLGLTKAVSSAMKRALADLQSKHPGLTIDEIIIDGHLNFLPEIPRTKAVIKADDSVPAVSAASIIAKVARDTYMSEQDAQYPNYAFGSHVGYGTTVHHTALKTHGPTILHRLSYKPVQSVLAKCTTTQRGRLAEARAAAFLEGKGFTVIERNWRTPWCEIDIIAKKDDTVYFVEVKYRRTKTSGGGMDYITTAKHNQMKRAAESWLQQHPTVSDYALSCVELSGPVMLVTDFVPNIE